jgi:hypothetical protein
MSRLVLTKDASSGLRSAFVTSIVLAAIAFGLPFTACNVGIGLEWFSGMRSLVSSFVSCEVCSIVSLCATILWGCLAIYVLFRYRTRGALVLIGLPFVLYLPLMGLLIQYECAHGNCP